MTALRLISLPTHGAIEMAGGLFLMAAPFVVGFTAGATVAAVVIGALVVGLALSSVDPGDRSLSVATHWALDYGVAMGLAASAAVFLVGGDALAGAVFAAVAIGQLALNVTTRYSLRG